MNWFVGTVLLTVILPALVLCPIMVKDKRRPNRRTRLMMKYLSQIYWTGLQVTIILSVTTAVGALLLSPYPFALTFVVLLGFGIVAILASVVSVFITPKRRPSISTL